jgi:hypothetical protein
LDELILAAPGLQNGGFAALQDEQGIALFALLEKELVPGNCHDRAKCEQELQNVRAYPTKEGHPLQQFGPRILHGALHNSEIGIVMLARLAFGYTSAHSKRGQAYQANLLAKS